MKSLISTVTAAFASVAAAENLVALEAKFGRVKSVSDLKPWQARGFSVSSSSDASLEASKERLKTRHLTNCSFPLNIVLLQDLSHSFQDDIEIMRKTQLSKMISELSSKHPKSQVSVVTFRDKPIFPFGLNGDFCHRVELPFTADAEKALETYSSLYASGGRDAPENQFGAILAACESEALDWSRTDPGATTLLVLATDAVPHFPGDGSYSGTVLETFSQFDEINAESQCSLQDYPTPTQVRAALAKRDAFMASLVFDRESRVRDVWQWFNSFIGQTDDFVDSMANDASDFWSKLAPIVEAVEKHQCRDAPTISTPAPEPEKSSRADENRNLTSAACGPSQDGPVLIRLAHRPKRLHLEVEN